MEHAARTGGKTPGAQGPAAIFAKVDKRSGYASVEQDRLSRDDGRGHIIVDRPGRRQIGDIATTLPMRVTQAGRELERAP